jgi:hypothetical protein
MLFSLVIAVLAAAQARIAPLDATRAVVSQPATICKLSGADIKGFPSRLSWSPDGSQLHLRVVQRDIWANRRPGTTSSMRPAES